MSGWIQIKPGKNSKIPEIRVERDGTVFVDGEPYSESNSRYRHFSVNVEKHNKLSLGEETEKMLQLQKEAKKGETKIVSETKDVNRAESTTVKF